MGKIQSRGHAAQVEHRRGLDGGRIWGRQGIGRQECANSFWGYLASFAGTGRKRKQAGAKNPGENGSKESCRFEWQRQIARVSCREERRLTERSCANDGVSRHKEASTSSDGEKEIAMAGSQIAVADKSKVNGAAETAGSAPVSFLEAIKQAMFEEMERDPAVVLLGEDVGVYGGAFKTSEGVLQRFGWERVIDTPISESAIIGAACGMSYAGLRPIAEMQFIDFISCAFNQITNFVAKGHYLWNAPAPMVMRGPSGGFVHGGPFHSANPEMYFVHTPGLKVIYPSTPYDAKGLLKAAVRDNNPVLFFEHKFLYRRIKGEVPTEDYTVPIGKAAVRREGKHLTILSYAAMMQTSLEAAEALAKEGIEAEVIDLRTLLPLDEDTILKSVKKTNKVLVVHEDTKTGGIAGEIAAILCEKAFGDLDGPLMRVTSLDTPVPYSPPLEEYFLPNAQKVFAAAKELARY